MAISKLSVMGFYLKRFVLLIDTIKLRVLTCLDFLILGFTDCFDVYILYSYSIQKRQSTSLYFINEKFS